MNAVTLVKYLMLTSLYLRDGKALLVLHIIAQIVQYE